jgi:8-amino-7-oxononanoate synthase
MSPNCWDLAVQDVLTRLHQTNCYRQRRPIVPLDSTHVEWRGRQFTNFASNDYLGLTHHPRVIEAAQRATCQFGVGSGASPLVCGYTPTHVAAEIRIAKWKGTEACVLLPSGYQANCAAIQTLAIGAHQANRPIRFLLDKLCHASLIDAVQASGQKFRTFPHGDLGKLERLLARASPGHVQVVVTESIFSMDGDAADLRSIVELKRRHLFLLLVDEAHASGVYGPDGSGLAAELGLSGEVDLTIATLSKAIGCVGGVVCGSRVFCDALINFARACIYSTSLPAHVAAAAGAAVEVMSDEPQRTRRVRQLAARVRHELARTKFAISRGDSPIIPILMGSESAALDAAEYLASQHMLALAIRPPTVARGSSRVRITLSSQHSDHEVDRLIDAIVELNRRA